MLTKRLLTLLFLGFCTLHLAACSGDDANPAGPGGGETGPVVLVLSDGGSETHVASILAEAGFIVRDGGPFHTFTGQGLDDVDGVVLLNGPDYNKDMDDAGEAALVGFVSQGGGLVTTEWLTFAVARSGYHQILQSILPTTYADSYGTGKETCTVLVDHPVTAGLPSSFDTTADNEYAVVAPRDGATQLIRGGRSGASVVTWSLPGRVVSWNGAAAYRGDGVWTAEIDRMLVNAAGFVCENARVDGPITSAPLSFRTTVLNVIHDGDNANGDGDFYISLRMTLDLGGTQSTLQGYSNVLVQASDGEAPAVDLVAATRLPEVDGFKVTCRLSYYENDGNGPQASAGTSLVYTYRAASGCWEREAGEACVGPGERETGSLPLENSSGDWLEAYLRWRFARG